MSNIFVHAPGTKDDLEAWLKARQLEIRPAETAFLRERALSRAAEMIAERIVGEMFPKYQEKLEEDFDTALRETIPLQLREKLLWWLEDHRWELIKELDPDEDQD